MPGSPGRLSPRTAGGAPIAPRHDTRGVYLFGLREREVPLLHVAHRQVHVDDDLIWDTRAGGLRLEVADVLAVDVHGDAAARLEL